MSKFFTVSQQSALLLFILALISSIHLCQAAPAQDDLTEDSNEVYQQRRTVNLDKLRRFLLTSSAEQRAAKREEQNFYKRELIREYLQSVDDPNRFQDVKKRIKTFCNSYEDVMDSPRAACG